MGRPPFRVSQLLLHLFLLHDRMAWWGVAAFCSSCVGTCPFFGVGVLFAQTPPPTALLSLAPAWLFLLWDCYVTWHGYVGPSGQPGLAPPIIIALVFQKVSWLVLPSFLHHDWGLHHRNMEKGNDRVASAHGGPGRGPSSSGSRHPVWPVSS